MFGHVDKIGEHSEVNNRDIGLGILAKVTINSVCHVSPALGGKACDQNCVSGSKMNTVFELVAQSQG